MSTSIVLCADHIASLVTSRPGYITNQDSKGIVLSLSLVSLFTFTVFRVSCSMSMPDWVTAVTSNPLSSLKKSSLLLAIPDTSSFARRLRVISDEDPALIWTCISLREQKGDLLESYPRLTCRIHSQNRCGRVGQKAKPRVCLLTFCS